jgi:hypothetical protein
MLSQFVCEAVASPRPCVVCSESFVAVLRQGPKPKYCSEKCSQIDRPDKDHVCIVCETPFKSKQSIASVCGKKCSAANLSKKIRAIHKLRGPPEHRKRVCLSCQKPFVMRNASGKARAAIGTEGKYCSRFCVSAARQCESHVRAIEVIAAKQAAKIKRAGASSRNCVCGNVAIKGHRRCADCRRTFESEKRQAKAVSKHEWSTPRRCLNVKCGSVFVPLANKTSQTCRRKFCSAACNKEYHKARGGSTHRKRARYHGVEYEYINPLKVMERDNYRCQVCGRAAPKRLRGSIDERAPELDHRIPMAMGGGHVWSNVQCACRRCNAAKGGTVIAGQTNFFADIEVARKHTRSGQLSGMAV